ncbi:MAG TPA: transglycosylase SLT domain-containing protein [Candidatus Acidoferrales bacterium]|nr:transglycosylase SLT domain-containing protein [Candidatus Acidoferrales bacterium]
MPKKGAATTAPAGAATRAAATSWKLRHLEHLCRTLKDNNSKWAYAQLADFANRTSSGVLGARAALALGFYDYSNGDYEKAAPWFALSLKDPLLRQYAIYWTAENDLALNQNADALNDLKEFRTSFPESVITTDALQALGAAAIAANQPQELIAALNAYPATAGYPSLLLLRGEAYEQAGQITQAAGDYQSLFLRFPTADQGREAALKLSFLAATPGNAIPPIPLEEQEKYAAAIFQAGYWTEARDAYSRILPLVTGADKERAQLRIVECSAFVNTTPTDLAALKVTDPDVDAERFHALAEVYRSLNQDADMATAVQGAASRAPNSIWTERALMLAGNQYWVELNRDQAASYYKQLADNFPDRTDAIPAQWRVAWTAVLKRDPGASKLLTEHIRRYPESTYVPDALYWLGRLSEEAHDIPVARSYYDELTRRFPEDYFEMAAEKRLRRIGKGAKGDPDVLALIPPAPRIPKLATRVPETAASWVERANALKSIAFDSSAQLEFQAAYQATREPRLLLEAAQEAIAADHVGAAIVAVRQIYPQLESHPFNKIPLAVWKIAYALPYQAEIHHWSAHAGVDPLLVAGLMRQESAFEKTAHSNANAMGLMQLEPETGSRMARMVRIRYSQAQLFDPDFNIRLGTYYLSQLQKQFGGVEMALAAYNAGEDRVTQWTTGQKYREPAEFVDSIPFTQTREYVEIVARNAAIYRRLYGAHHESRHTPNGNVAPAKTERAALHKS